MADHTSLHVLIIEDDHYSIDVLAGLFRGLRISYTSLKDGTNVIETLGQLDHIDIIFCDLELPQVNGYRVLEQIRAMDIFKEVLVIAYTSHINEMTNARRSGFNGFLSKPLNGRDFSTQLDRILNRDEVWE